MYSSFFKSKIVLNLIEVQLSSYLYSDHSVNSSNYICPKYIFLLFGWLGSNFYFAVYMTRECAVTLNQYTGSKVKIENPLCKTMCRTFSLSRVQLSPKECLSVENLKWLWNNVLYKRLNNLLRWLQSKVPNFIYSKHSCHS